MNRKGIILAGGAGTRLFPVTRAVSKQLVPVYDKPMVYYPLSVLMLAGIRETLVITTPEDRSAFERLLGDGAQWGMNISFAVQHKPDGIAQAFLIGRAFLDGAKSCLVLGDNIFYGHGLTGVLLNANARNVGASIFGYHTHDPSAYGVAEFDARGNVIGLEEKPARPKSSYAVTGLYFYDERASDFAATLKPSTRGELEITDLSRRYLQEGQLHLERLGRGIAWLDTGTHDAMLQAASFVQAVQTRQGMQIACPEEIAFNNGWIDAQQVRRLAAPLQHSHYGRYLLRLVGENA